MPNAKRIWTKPIVKRIDPTPEVMRHFLAKVVDESGSFAMDAHKRKAAGER